MKEKGKGRIWEGDAQRSQHDRWGILSADLAETFGSRQEVAVCVPTAGGVVERDPS